MRIYISGPITGVEDYEKKFDEAEKFLRGAYPDAKFVNPVWLCKVYQDGTHEDYMDINLQMLDKCDAICMLRGWRKSTGACIEYGYALAEKFVVIEV